MKTRQYAYDEIENAPLIAMTEALKLEEDSLALRLPCYMWPGLAKYLILGIKPGPFLTSVLAGEKELAARHADAVNVTCLDTYFAFLARECPAACWGSPAKVRAWVEKGGLVGRDG